MDLIFLRINMPQWTSIGIHGTCFPESIGTRDSEGCIRLLNKDLIRLMSLVRVGTKVIILPDIEN
ncbi:MAG: L,D-transpeptidase [Paramuribaculum sp.]|nr:L,D-transpeptidase [Paramuribaculum sp.]MDE5836597.1 L,D-transpeptidase [Paramuribaculum sp.]